MDLATVLQMLQTASVILAVLVAAGTIKGRSDDKASVLTGMQKDIEYIKRNTDCIPTQTSKLVELEASCKSAHKRLDDHLKYDHQKKEDSQ